LIGWKLISQFLEQQIFYSGILLFKMNTISLITDFGLSDGYVGCMKGVVYSLGSNCQVVDIAHDIERGDIDSAGFVLYQCYRFFPQGTIHVIVVDPEVGSSRKILCVQTAKYIFLSPDNGVLKYIFHYEKTLQVYMVNKAQYFMSQVSQTFHGRDVFAPVAAWLCRGKKTKQMGPLYRDYEQGSLPQAKRRSDRLQGQIIHIDRFGNLITNIESNHTDFRQRFTLKVRNKKAHCLLLSAYSEGLKNEPLLIWGSHGFLEIAVKNSSAAKILNVKRGDAIELLWS